MRIKSFKAIHPNMEMVSSPEVFFGRMKYDYTDFVKSGFFSKKGPPAMYIYRISSKDGMQTGIIAAIDIKDIKDDKLKKHENTLAYKEQALTHLLLDRNAMIKPVLVGFPEPSSKLDRFVENIIRKQKTYFEIRFEEEQEQHLLWEIADVDQIKKLKRIFRKTIPVSYIADGHHRCSTTVKMYESQKIKSKPKGRTVLAAFFSFKELKIHDFSRVVEMFNDVDPTDFGIALSKYCHIKSHKNIEVPNTKFKFNMCIKGKWYRLVWKKSVMKKYKKKLKNKELLLDLTLFNHYILKKILKVEDIRRDERIQYVAGNLGLKAIEEAITNKNNWIGFSFCPLNAKDIMDTADRKNVLPPKSSFFEPRIKNGMIVKSF